MPDANENFDKKAVEIQADAQLLSEDKPVSTKSIEDEVVESLKAYNPVIADCYEGALNVLKGGKNSDSIAQSAHSFREIFYMVRVLAILTKEEKKTLESERTQLSMTGVLFWKIAQSNGYPGDFRDPVFSELNRKIRFFVKVAHHEHLCGKEKDINFLKAQYFFKDKINSSLLLKAMQDVLSFLHKNFVNYKYL